MMLLPLSHTNRTIPAHRGGAHVVEFAMVAPVVFLVVLGMIEIANGLMFRNVLNEAARRGCRRAVRGDASTADVKTEIENFFNSSEYLKAKALPNYFMSIEVEGAVTTEINNTAYEKEMTVKVGILDSKIKNISWVNVAGWDFFNKLYVSRYTMRRE